MTAFSTLSADCGKKDCSCEPLCHLRTRSYGVDACAVDCCEKNGEWNPYSDRLDYNCGWYRWGDWLPEDPPLFRQFVADPRQVTYSVGWRFNDDALCRNTIPVSFGDYFGLYRWHCACGLTAAIWNLA